MRSYVDGAFAAAGAQPHHAFESMQLSMVRDLASRGLGIAIMPRTFATGAGSDVAVAVLELDLGFRLPVNLLTRADRRASPATAA